MSRGVAVAGQVALSALILLAFIACGLCSNTCECDTPQVRAVLTRFYIATGGTKWQKADGWTSSRPVCSWYGITCHGADLTDIDLNSNFLNGSLPADLANITSIQQLDLGHNQLFGSLPPQWVAMTQLIVLNLGSNQLSGTLPPEWSRMQVKELLLFNTLIGGSLPPQWGAMSQLKSLDLSFNRINGTLPPEWSNMTKLEKLDLNNNQVPGSLPPEWSGMTKCSPTHDRSIECSCTKARLSKVLTCALQTPSSAAPRSFLNASLLYTTATTITAS